MYEENLSYGLLLERRCQYGSDYVTARFIAREGGKDYPVNSSYHALDGFTLTGHVYKYRAEPASFIGFNPEYRDVFAIDRRKAEKMADCLRKVERQIAKDAASSPAEIFMSVARAFKLSFAVSRAGKAPERSTYSDNDWTWWTVPDGKRHLEGMIAAACADADKAGGKIVWPAA